MTDFLVKKFVPNYTSTDSVEVRTAYGRLSGIVGIICNVIMFVFKLAAGFISGSISITADAFNNLSDASSSIISLIGFKLASMPPDREHPYGHGRYEYLSGLVVSALVIAIGIELFTTGVRKIITPEAVEFGVLPAVVLILSAALKLWMMLFNRRLGNRISSGALLATAADSRGDVISSCAVLVSAIISSLTGFELDGYAAVAVSVFIVISGIGLVRDTLDPILGKAPSTETVRDIRDRILTYPGVLGIHDLIVHDYGPGRTFASVHVEMSADTDPLESHDIIDNIERDFAENRHLQLIVHYDPIVTNDPEVESLRIYLHEHLHEIGAGLTFHDLRLVRGASNSNVIFDCIMPYGMSMSESELREKISELVRQKYPSYNCVITIDRNFCSE